MYITNAFSAQMMSGLTEKFSVDFTEIDALPKDVELESAIGHADTAVVLGFPMNRVSISLNRGDKMILAQLQGGRLPEGSTTLPEGFSFRYYLVEVR